MLVDSGATHNFIDAHMVEQRGIYTETFEGILVLVPKDNVTPHPPKSTQATNQSGKTCDERGHYKGFNLLGNLKEMELT